MKNAMKLKFEGVVKNPSNQFAILLFLAFFVFQLNTFAQEKIVVSGSSKPEGTTVMIPDSDGTLVQRFVYDDVALGDQMVRAELMETISSYRDAGYEELLEFVPTLGLEGVGEISQSQVSAIKETLEKYRSLTTHDMNEINLLRRKVKWLDKLREIVPPSALDRSFVHSSKNNQKRLYTETLVLNHSFDDRQRIQLMEECELIQDELKAALKEVEAIEKRCRDKYKLIFKKVYSKPQQAVTMSHKGMSFEKFLSLLTVKDMCNDTNVQAYREKVKK